MACIGKELMPTEERESISHIKPSGWNQAQYDIVDGGNLYNRCHLIAFQLTGENDNERNLITGTRYMNNEGMLPFENMVADYIKETGNRVVYRVTPIYDGNNLVAAGVQMEAKSVEDDGEGICFNVFIYNSQPGVNIDYSDGSSELADNNQATETFEEDKFLLNVNSKKFHKSNCAQGMGIADKNKKEYAGTRQSLIDDGYEPAGCCKP
jgi:DNA-entry nuclease